MIIKLENIKEYAKIIIKLVKKNTEMSNFIFDFTRSVIYFYGIDSIVVKLDFVFEVEIESDKELYYYEINVFKFLKLIEDCSDIIYLRKIKDKYFLVNKRADNKLEKFDIRSEIHNIDPSIYDLFFYDEALKLSYSINKEVIEELNIISSFIEQDDLNQFSGILLHDNRMYVKGYHRVIEIISNTKFEKDIKLSKLAVIIFNSLNKDSQINLYINDTSENTSNVKLSIDQKLEIIFPQEVNLLITDFSCLEEYYTTNSYIQVEKLQITFILNFFDIFTRNILNEILIFEVLSENEGKIYTEGANFNDIVEKFIILNKCSTGLIGLKFFFPRKYLLDAVNMIKDDYINIEYSIEENKGAYNIIGDKFKNKHMVIGKLK